MTYFQRLVEAGIDPDCAVETCHRFQAQDDEASLKAYVEKVERMLNKAYRRCSEYGV